MKEIPLTYNRVALVDDEDYCRISKYKWHYKLESAYRTASFGKDIFGARITKTISIAREILNVPKHLLVDHVNHNRLDNRKSNLRMCTRQENNRNSRKLSSCTSEYKGVCWHKQNQKWTARLHTKDIFNQSVQIYLGCFKTEEEAARAYDAAARYHFEEFACLNFPNHE